MSGLFQGTRRTIASLAQRAEESRMVGRELWEELHRARAVDGLSVSALASRFGLDRKTVRRCLSQSQWRPYRRAARPPTHHVHILEMNGESFRLSPSRARKKCATH